MLDVFWRSLCGVVMWLLAVVKVAHELGGQNSCIYAVTLIPTVLLCAAELFATEPPTVGEEEIDFCASTRLDRFLLQIQSWGWYLVLLMYTCIELVHKPRQTFSGWLCYSVWSGQEPASLQRTGKVQAHARRFRKCVHIAQRRLKLQDKRPARQIWSCVLKSLRATLQHHAAALAQYHKNCSPMLRRVKASLPTVRLPSLTECTAFCVAPVMWLARKWRALATAFSHCASCVMASLPSVRFWSTSVAPAAVLQPVPELLGMYERGCLPGTEAPAMPAPRNINKFAVVIPRHARASDIAIEIPLLGPVGLDECQKIMAYCHDKHGDDTAHPDETVAIRAAQVGHVLQYLLDWVWNKRDFTHEGIRVSLPMTPNDIFKCAGEVIRRQGVGVGDAAWNRRMSQLRDINPADMGTDLLNNTGAFDRCDRVCCACLEVCWDGEPAGTNAQGQVTYAAKAPVLEVTVWYCNLCDQEGRGDGRMPVCSSCVKDCVDKGRCPDRCCAGFSRHNCCTRRIPQGLLRDVARLEDISA